MELIINDTDIREAVVAWLADKSNMHILPEHLIPVMESEGEYEDTRYHQIGFKVDFSKIEKEPIE